MAISKNLSQDNIRDALKYIDEHGTPARSKPQTYALIYEGKQYSVRYVIAVADYLVGNTSTIALDGDYNSIQCNSYLEKLGFKISTASGKMAISTNLSDVVATSDSKSDDSMDNWEKLLFEAKNIILRGAPGTGKSYLAKQIASYIVSDHATSDYSELSDEQKKQIEFVQFHPSYDYTDFVEGLRPVTNDDGSMGFVLQDGTFKKFVNKARKNYEDHSKGLTAINEEKQIDEIVDDFFNNADSEQERKTKNGTSYFITDYDGEHITIRIPSGKIGELLLKAEIFRRMLKSGKTFETVKDVTNFRDTTQQSNSYYFKLYEELKELVDKKVMPLSPVAASRQERPKSLKYVFIIDEINRGEISKIFGELFYSLDPGYRGPRGEINTQYSNMHEDPSEKFYVPENVYIIGTMNDIDRSVDSFDFAMRRRFSFIEIKANENIGMLNGLPNKDEVIRRMELLNEEIAHTHDLNENYQIGAAYFLKLDHLSYEALWENHLSPLLHDYVQGMEDEDKIMANFKKAYEGVRDVSIED